MSHRPPDDRHYRKLERAYANAPINEYFEPRLTIGPGTAELVIPVQKKFFHAGGAIHGSIYFKALDDAAFFAAQSVVLEVFVLTVSFNLYFLRPVVSGTLTANARLTFRSRRLFVAEAVLLDERNREVAQGSGTFMRSQIRLDGLVGYE